MTAHVAVYRRGSWAVLAVVRTADRILYSSRLYPPVWAGLAVREAERWAAGRRGVVLERRKGAR